MSTLDKDYFKRKLSLVIRDESNYTGPEMARELIRLAKVADSSVAVIEMARSLDIEGLRRMLGSLQNCEMSVSRAVELLEYWAAGKYTDDLLPEQELNARDSVLQEAADLAIQWGNARVDEGGGHALRNYAAELLARKLVPGPAPGLSLALEKIDLKAEAGLCQMTHEGSRAFLKDIRLVIKEMGNG